ncbi:MAG: ArnT family glycosyltransferase [Burkholderiales bacterium]
MTGAAGKAWARWGENSGKALLVVVLAAAWLLPGLVGHDPWKPDEAYSFGLVYHFIHGGDWVVPMLGGEPFMEKPPLYYLTAALFARLFSFLLPLHDGARLASGFYIGLALYFTALTGRELLGRDKGGLTLLLLIGSLGLLVRAHEMITDTAQFTGFALAFYGLALLLRRPVPGGIALGCGTGIGFMAKGLLAPGAIGIVALLLPLFPAWRNRRYALALGVAALAALPWFSVWPIALYQRSPQLFEQWLWVNNLGRFLGTAHLGPSRDPYFYLQTLPWYTWPAWPLALWGLWRGRRQALGRTAVQLPLTLFAVVLAVLAASSDARELYAMPLLLPLAVLAADGVDSLRRGAAGALDWFGFMTFGLFSGFLWLGWIAMMTGWPAKLAERAHVLQPAYVPSIEAGPLAVAVAFTLTWLLLISRLGRSNRRAVINWAAGLTLMWGLLTTLWLPWIDTGKSYRAMMQEIKQALPVSYNCLSSEHLGEPQRALLLYFAGINSRRLETGRGEECDVRLIQGGVDNPPSLGEGWKPLWDGARPGDNNERYWLLQRLPRPAAP